MILLAIKTILGFDLAGEYPRTFEGLSRSEANHHCKAIRKSMVMNTRIYLHL